MRFLGRKGSVGASGGEGRKTWHAMRGRDGPASHRACSTTIVIAVVVREEAEVEAIAVMIAMFEARHVVAIFVSLGTALQAGECEHANSGGTRQRDDVLRIVGSFGRAVKAFDVSDRSKRGPRSVR